MGIALDWTELAAVLQSVNVQSMHYMSYAYFEIACKHLLPCLLQMHLLSLWSALGPLPARWGLLSQQWLPKSLQGKPLR